jgi:O-methyltransferase
MSGMSFKDRVNKALTATTGYQISRATSAAADPQPRPDAQADVRLQAVRRHRRRRRELSREVRRLTRANEGLRQRAKDRRHRLPSYVDAATRDIIARSQPRTLTGVEKLWPLVDAVRYIAAHDVPGALVECGVWRGGSVQAVAWTLLEAGVSDRELHLFDTFEGMSAPTEDDVRTSTGATAVDLLAAGKAKCEADYDDVHQGMTEIGYPMDLIHLHQGKVEDTVPGEAPDQIALLRLDTDWYESTKHELEHLYPRLAPGGVLIIDDFGSWDGARKATLEWLEQTGERLLLVPIGAARIGIKLA